MTVTIKFEIRNVFITFPEIIGILKTKKTTFLCSRNRVFAGVSFLNVLKVFCHDVCQD